MANGQTGNTATIAFATTSFVAAIKTIGGSEFTREPLDDTDLAVTDQMTFVPDDLVNAGELESQHFWDQSATVYPPIDQPPEVITVTYPLKSGEGTAATLSGTGFLTKSKGADLENGVLMMGTFTVKWDGKTPATYTPGSV